MSKIYLNVYGQDEDGDSVIIVGNRAGLQALAEALKQAKSSRGRGASKVIASDGIQYDLKIYHGDPLSTRGGAGREFWKELCWPYHERLKMGDSISPWEWD